MPNDFMTRLQKANDSVHALDHIQMQLDNIRLRHPTDNRVQLEVDRKQEIVKERRAAIEVIFQELLEIAIYN